MMRPPESASSDGDLLGEVCRIPVGHTGDQRAKLDTLVTAASAPSVT